MKPSQWIVFVVAVALSAPSFAEPDKVEGDGYDVMVDMFLRPVGMAATLIGAGIFVGVSPLTALATIAPPHDAFEKLGDTIVCKPFKWTFNRPSGDYRYDEGCANNPKPVAYQSEPPVMQPSKPVVNVPIQYPQDTNKKIDQIFKKRMMK